MSVFHNNALIGASGGAAADDAAAGSTKSLRFNSGDSAYLSRTPSSAGNRKTWTWSGWVKIASLGTNRGLFSATTTTGSDNNRFAVWLNSSDKIIIFEDISGTLSTYRLTDQVFRDTSAWYHIVIAFDTTQSTADDRIKLYINGSQVTSFTTNNAITQNRDTFVNSTVAHGIGVDRAGSDVLWNGYLADVYFIDGSALTPTSFGAYDDNGVWQSAAYSGTFGTNGFHLDFADGSDLGDDNSGNSNDWTPNNLSNFDGTVATADGALPILNTTGNYGGTVGSGTRTDSNSSSIVLALPMNGTNGGTTFTDQHATIKGSGSAKTITAYADAQTSTAQSYFYGSSAKFDGTGDYLASTETDIGNFGTGDFTVEYWANNNSTQPSPNYSPQVGTLADSTPDNTWRVGTFQSNGKFTLATHDGSGFVDVTFNTTNYNDDKWHHFCMQRSSGTVTAYVDGVSIGTATVTTNFSATKPLQIGREGYSPTHYTGYIQDLRIYKGAAKYSSNFNPPSRTGGSVCDSLFDVPTNGTQSDTGAGGEVSGNYCTLNPLHANQVLANVDISTLSDGNLKSSAASNANKEVSGTIGVSSGKWYFELTNISGGSNNDGVGICNLETGIEVIYRDGGSFRYDGTTTSSYGATWRTSGDIIGVAIDLDNTTIAFYKNGVSQGNAKTDLPAGTYHPYVYNRAGAPAASELVANFGQRAFAYSAPSSYKALCTTNLPTPTIADGSDYFDTKLYTGNGSTLAVTGLEFSPDFTWIKRRDVATSHLVYDTIRGAGSTGELIPNATNSEGHPTDTNAAAFGYLNSFDSAGFTVKAGTTNGVYTNQSASTYVSWNWDAGSSTVSNTDGDITSSCRTSTASGFSIVSWTGNGSSNQTVGHNLGVVPELIIAKNRDTTNSWAVWTTGFNANEYLVLNSNGAKATFSGQWGSTPTSTVFGVNDSSVNGSGNDIIAYCFSSVSSFSQIGNYTGNGSSDGPFIFVGFRIGWLLIRDVTSSGVWYLFDSARQDYNPQGPYLEANTSDAEETSSPVDILSNGFKIRNNLGSLNTSSETYLYYAIAENPFQANGGLAR